ncbi:hypothetical protein IIE18_10535 [Pseudomonas sp. V1]|uniref:hypothetical protein n=1 Tax=Pseudomonas arcuscaelestis TaxID=2710591 RepID=UPI00193FAD14|nr:hypothetical protein [Pseudomonas arcuscaelestis]MBM3105576.1 hypothetical protein [Pseudomonas arcuscaelestis]
MTDQVERDFVYLGRRQGQDKKVYGFLAQISDGALGKSAGYELKAMNRFVIGGVYRGASFSESSVFNLNAAQLVNTWADTAEVIDWQAKDTAVDSDLRYQKLVGETKRRNQRQLEATLLPLRRVYASHHRRRDVASMEALERALLAALRSPLRPEER